MGSVVVHHRFTVDDYEQMIAQGFLTEQDRVELIRGEILTKMPVGDRHAACVKRLNRWLVRALADRAIVSVQDPIRLGDSEPEPELALLRPRADFYASGKPEAGDVLLIVEVADSSLGFDRDEKRALYAEAGIADYWIVNLLDDTLEVHRQPRPDGTYGERRVLARGDAIESLACPDLAIAVAAML